jgi:beta-phosphoglucomutase-like phosphatase (HAD superfamily)
MSQPAPLANLDEILRQTRHLLLDFDGPVCTLYPDQSAAMVARRLLTTVATLSVAPPEPIAKTADPLAVLSFATTISPDLAARIESDLSDQELTAAATATPAGHIHDLITSCRDSSRTVTVISQISARAVNSYLERNSLAGAVDLVLARDRPSPLTSDADLIKSAFVHLNTAPVECALVTASAVALKAARLAGVHAIGYARASDALEALTAAGADALIPSLADLALRLRARPLPN